jgi:hypothetical protein
MAEPLTIVSLAIGGWGAGLSTVLGVRQVRHDRRTLGVRCEVGYAARQHRGLQEVVTVTAVNEGHRPVEVLRVSFRLDDGYDVHAMIPADTPQPDLPKLLGDGQSVTLLYAKDLFDRIEKEEGRRVVSAIVTDASGTEFLAPYTSPPSPGVT